MPSLNSAGLVALHAEVDRAFRFFNARYWGGRLPTPVFAFFWKRSCRSAGSQSRRARTRSADRAARLQGEVSGIGRAERDRAPALRHARFHLSAPEPPSVRGRAGACDDGGFTGSFMAIGLEWSPLYRMGPTSNLFRMVED